MSEEGQSGVIAGRELGAEPAMDSAPCTDAAAAERTEGQSATDTGVLSAPQAEGGCFRTYVARVCAACA